MATNDYLFGDATPELDRLQLQARWLEPLTERLLRASGIGEGQHVLDVGTGTGGVAIVAARLVGRTGSVIGIDPSTDALARAEAQARAEGLEQLHVETASLADLDPYRRFDAVIGRFIIEHQPDGPAFLRHAASFIRPGGVVAFVEPAFMSGYQWSVPPEPTWERVHALIVEAFKLNGARIDQGLHFTGLFADAGLPQPELLGEFPTASPSSSLVDWGCATLDMVRGELEKAGTASREEIDKLVAVDRVRAATQASGSQLFEIAQVGAWARLPA